MDLGKFGSNESNQLQDASFPEALEKYKTAGVIANTALHMVLSACRPGKRIVELCQSGDDKIMEDIGKVYPELKVRGQKGISFPTCVSVNEIAGHHSPFSDDKRTLHLGDMVKVDLGVHIDGFCAVVAHTIVLGPCNGKKADSIAAAWSAAQSALRLCKVGNKNAQVTLAIQKSAKAFQAEPMDSVLSHEMRQYVIDHDHTIISKETEERKVAEIDFEPYQVFGIDIMMSSGKGKAIDRGEKCSIYKRNVEVECNLKMKTSRDLLKVVNKQFPTFPFSMRNLEKERCRLGIGEMVRNQLVQPYPVLSERNGSFVAQFKFTVVIGPNATIQITGLPLDMSSVHPSQQIKDTELTALLSTKFDGHLPAVYEAVEIPKFDPMVMEQKSDGDRKKQSGKGNGPKKSGQQRRNGQSKGKGGNKKGGNHRNKKGNQKRKGNNAQKRRGGGSGRNTQNRRNNQSGSGGMDLD